MSAEKVTLGRHLFYDLRMSGNQKQACASCHIQSLAFSDQHTVGSGSTNELHPRSPQQLDSPGYHLRLTWANNTVIYLEEQAKAPMYGTSPVELGLTDPSSGTPEVIQRLKDATDVDYIGMFKAAFGGNGSDEITDLNIRRAVAAFERTIISGNSYYDQYGRTRNPSVFTSAGLDSAKVLRGAGIFFEETGDCFHCHSGFNYDDSSSLHSGAIDTSYSYHSNGLYSTTSYNAMTDNKKGLYAVTLDNNDIGRFRAPSLRNLGVTYPYMHDGSIKCAAYTEPKNSTDPAYILPTADINCAREALTNAVQNYNLGGQGGLPSIKDPTMIRALSLTAGEKADLAEFLLSLTDTEFLTRESLSNPQFGNPNFVNHH
jgi:cytochrome c peroxidase